MRTFRKCVSLLLCLLLMPLFTVPAGGEADTAGEEEIRQNQEDEVNRFGITAEVEKDASGKVVRVNGFPVRTVRAGFNSIGYRSTLRYVTDFMDYPFWRPSTEYDGNLAAMSLVMALCANRAAGYSNISSGEYDPSVNVAAFLEDAGFTDIRQDDYSRVPTMFTVSTAMGSRAMEAEGEEPFTLIAVGVCGAGYGNEWISNLTPGEGKHHEGFFSAAQLVVDRISGYIATHGIRGRVKIWISGFSRAGAVSNLTAGILNDTGMFPKEDVYAYTFATPAAVVDPPASGYENIFNIINPTDLIPQVMPSDWHFGRYGTDLFLPTQEYSSFIGEAARDLREETNLQEFGVENRYSPSLNFRTRLMFSLLLNLVDSREKYNELFQPTLASILENKSIPSSLATLRSLMRGLRGSDTESREDLDELLDFTVRVLVSAAAHSGLGRADRNTENPFLLLFNEHRENAYLASAYIIREGFLDPNTVSWYVLVKGPVSVFARIEYADSDAFGVSITSDGKSAAETPSGFSPDSDFADLLYLDRIGNTTVAAIPMDMAWSLRWVAEKDGEVECMVLCMRTSASREYEVYTVPKRTVHAGDSAEVLAPVTDGSRLPAAVPADALVLGVAMPVEGFEKGTMEARQVAEFLEIASVGINWRAALMLLCALLGGAACIVICIIASRHPRRKKRYAFPVWLLLCAFGISVLETETAYWFFADRELIRLIWKGAAALSVLGIFFLTRLPAGKGRLLSSCLPALLLALAADYTVSLHPAAGVILYAVFHLLLCAFFLRMVPLPRKRRIQWILFSLPLAAAAALLFGRKNGLLGWAVTAMAPAMLLTVFTSAAQAPRFRRAARLILLSELLMGVYQGVSASPVLHAGGVLLFYSALLLLVFSPGGAEPRTDQASASSSDPH